MRTFRHLLVPALITALGSSPVQAAQRHVVDSQSIADAVRQHSDSQDQARNDVREALARSEVQALASRTGIDVSRLSTAVGTMTGTDLERAAEAARDVNQALVGGASTVTISTTTIIIALLVIILIIVAVN
jgi:hypothetical protein